MTDSRDPGAGVESERAAFEAWLPKSWSRETFKDDEGDAMYREDWVQGAWAMWCHWTELDRLRASLPAAPSVAVAWRYRVRGGAWEYSEAPFFAGGKPSANEEHESLTLAELIAALSSQQPSAAPGGGQRAAGPDMRYAPIIKAAINLLAACQERHDTRPSPHKYSVPYGEVVALHNALNGIAAPCTATAAREQETPVWAVRRNEAEDEHGTAAWDVLHPDGSWKTCMAVDAEDARKTMMGFALESSSEAPAAPSAEGRALPDRNGVYAWVTEHGHSSLVLVSKRPTAHSPGGVLNGSIMESSKFYDGCPVEQWGKDGRWVLLHDFAAPTPATGESNE